MLNVSKILEMNKEYIGKIKLGAETDTLDKTGTIYKRLEIPSITNDLIEGVLKKFKGTIKQVPPAFSALKLKGKCLYDYARAGIWITKKPRKVLINSINLIEHNNMDEIVFQVSCGSGTYIRRLASDIAIELGTCGFLSELKRVRVGEYTKENSLTLEDLSNGKIG